MNEKTGKALVVGAGIGGIRAALDLAEIGCEVTLIDREPNMGGILGFLDDQFPSDRCGMCKMLPLIERDASSQYCLRKGLYHRNIDIQLSTDILSIQGDPGNFEVTLKQRSNWVDPQKCIGCGFCADACPVEVPDVFNAGLSERKAVYQPVPHAVANPYVIDPAACTQCGECVRLCPTGAIRIGERQRQSCLILVVDDEGIVRNSLKEILEEEGYSVETATSGPDALAKLAQTEFHLMLADIKMPGMDGIELLGKAAAVRPGLDVVMMTAYATVDTAVEAMKIGAIDYLIKPFDTNALVRMINGIHAEKEISRGPKLQVGAIVLAAGAAYFNPFESNNTFGYKIHPNVVTGIELERIYSGTGPTKGRLTRPSDGKPIERIAWILCVGSRNRQLNADFCSSVCCMYAIKEALIAKKKSGGRIETTLFYMDMRTFGKSFQRYRENAENIHGVRFERCRVHSVVPEKDSGDVRVDYIDPTGMRSAAPFDLAVLAVGQRPAKGSAGLAEAFDIPMNPWGFLETEAFSLTRTSRQGVLLAGAFGGLKDIGESVITASAAALNAARVIHSTGGLRSRPDPSAPLEIESLRHPPRIMVAICTCDAALSTEIEVDRLIGRLKSDPAVCAVSIVDKTCTPDGIQALLQTTGRFQFNRLLLGACMPYVHSRKGADFAAQTGMDPRLVEIVDIRSPMLETKGSPQADTAKDRVFFALQTGIARLKRIDPAEGEAAPVVQGALVVGAGIAGMNAAIGIAENGFQVDLVEIKDKPGGNTRWIGRTVDGKNPAELLDETIRRMENHPLITLHTQTRIAGASGQAGRFITALVHENGETTTVEHGAVIIATGGTEAESDAYGHGAVPAVVTQKELEEGMADNRIDPQNLDTVVMIQCVGSRVEPRNYCSRICCTTALKNALTLKEKNPDIAIFVFYRDMMSYGFAENAYTRARAAGIVFIRYEPERPPKTLFENNRVIVTGRDPIVDKMVEIEADMLVLAVGIVPTMPKTLIDAYGASVDVDGFFKAAESKWRPVDALTEGVFACGLSLAPYNIPESIATAEAAAQRALRILANPRIRAGKITAKIRTSLCSLCERCIEACPYQARFIDPEEEKVRINPIRCQGCGACAAICPNGAAYLEGFAKEAMFEIIDAAIESGK